MSMRIGQLAAKTGVTADTIRYYERLGLLPAPARSASGYREYADGVVTRVALIRNAVRLGFPLKEILRFLHVRDAGGAPCRQVRDYGEHLVKEIDSRITELGVMRKSMNVILREWDKRLSQTAKGSRAHLLESLPRRVAEANAHRGRW
jgi:DNA-binding transcriptional MerR regulator